MNEEIKEILDDLKSKEYDDISLIICEVISRKKIKCILNYITNLQKENERLKADNIFLKNEISKLAKKYLKNDLLKILGGDE